MEIGKRDLQQCADAVIRLRAEYLYKHKAYDRIHFNFTNGFRADYTKWAEGYRISVKGNQVSWYKSKEKDYSYKTFRAYLDVVFAYAGTLSLAKELTSVPVTSMQIGDVLIQGGSPGTRSSWSIWQRIPQQEKSCICWPKAICRLKIFKCWRTRKSVINPRGTPSRERAVF